MSITGQVRALAFFLPQFHPIPENDAWWGRGFTEWTNVVRARPHFSGHYQPRLPADFGFYDLRVPEVRENQAALARSYGIHGFIYYHYWFGGKRLLERPLDEIRSTGTPDFPFAVCWANETWSRRWNGQEKDVLIQQQYSDQDDREHIEFLLDVMEDDRYITVDGRPLLLVYRISQLPDASRTADVWRSAAARRGRELHLCNVESFGERMDPSLIGFDASVEFVPQRRYLGPRVGLSPIGRVARKLIAPNSPYRRNNVTLYKDMVANALAEQVPGFPFYRCVTPSWDNSARVAQGARIVHGSSPELYGHWLAELARRQPRDGLLFINAWNEWAEGAYLEPDQQWGHAYLEATRDALLNASATIAAETTGARTELDREIH